MKYAIIAAGEGSRLAKEGVNEPKPLVKINGETLIDRLMRVFADNGAESIVVVYRNKMTDVAAHLERLRTLGVGERRVPVEIVAASTPSSMHSFYAISDKLKDGPFCLTTVDTVFSETAFKQYTDKFKAAVAAGYDGTMGVTGYIDDEKPLYVKTDDEMNITAFNDDNDGNCKLVSAGVYGLTPHAVDVLRECIDNGESRMRNFQRALLRKGMRLKAADMGKTFDIDHASDIEKGEKFLRNGR